jgi:hypothetical protein
LESLFGEGPSVFPAGSLTGSGMTSRSTAHIPHAQEREMEVEESSGSEEEYSDSGEGISESEEEDLNSGSETVMRPVPSLAGDPVPGRIESSARVGLDQVRRVGEWDQDFYPSAQVAGAAGPGNRLTSETAMSPRPRSHSEFQRDDHRSHATLSGGSTNPAGPLAGHGVVAPTRGHTHIGMRMHGHGHGRGHVHDHAHTHGHGHALTTDTVTGTTTTTTDRGIKPRASALK